MFPAIGCTGRRTVLVLFACILAAVLPRPLQGESQYPSRSVRIIVPHPPGQAADLAARLLAQKLSSAWGRNVVVENRAGGVGHPGHGRRQKRRPRGVPGEWRIYAVER